MSLSSAQRVSRLRNRLPELLLWRDREWLDLNTWSFDGRRVALGEAWPHRDGLIHLFHPQISVPDSWPIDQSVLDLDLGGEGLVHLRYSDGSEEGFGLDPHHHRLPLRQARFEIRVEAVARLPFGVPNRAARLEGARLVRIEPDLDRLYRLLWLCTETLAALPDHDVTLPLLDLAEETVAMLDWPTGTAEYVARIAHTPQMQEIWELPSGLSLHPAGLAEGQRQSVVEALARLEHGLSELRAQYPPAGFLAITGHAHLDLAWLWPLEETRRKAQRTYHSVVALMDRYPEMRFNQSSAQLYAFIEEDDPALFAAIRERVAAGQWEPIGGMWVEPDTNMPCGESLARQLLYGQRYFQQHFGSLHTVCWLPDCFGFSPALPQLLQSAGVDHFFTIKVNWSESNHFPYDLFWWEGLDGSRVLAHTFDSPHHLETDTEGYNADPNPFALVSTWRNFRGKAVAGQSLLAIGYGDGGGGVTTDMVERVRELQRFPALPEARFSTVRDFYEIAAEAAGGAPLPVWVGEIYLELHRGTLTSQGRLKHVHRRAERELIAAEVLASLAHLLGGARPPSLEPLWRIVLRNQFHDILPGSSIREVYDTAEQELATVCNDAQTSLQSSLKVLAEHVVPPGPHPALMVVNPDLSPRPLRIQTASGFPGSQPVGHGAILTTGEDIDGLETRVILDGHATAPVEFAHDRLENALLRVGLAPDGTLLSVWDKQAKREVLAGPANALWAYVDKPPTWDAWDIDAGYAQDGEHVPATGEPQVVEHGPHRAAIRFVHHFRSSTVTQDIRLWANSARLEFATTIDWHDRRWLLKARFPLAIRSSRATFETAFGTIERSTHRNTSWEAARFEVAAHRFVDISEPGYGVALLNDGKYGHHAIGNELGISLLRSPIYPDPLADEGTHSFTYALLPHTGGWLEGGVLMEAEDLNSPLRTYLVEAAQPTSVQPLRIAGFPLGLGCLKPAEDGAGLVLRLYEPQGARGTPVIELPNGWQRISPVDLLERPLEGESDAFSPFAVRSWLLTHRQ